MSVLKNVNFEQEIRSLEFAVNQIRYELEKENDKLRGNYMLICWRSILFDLRVIVNYKREVQGKGNKFL